MAAKLRRLGFSQLTEIQKETLQPIFDGKDVIGQAPSGTGKTLAFLIPLLDRLLGEESERLGWRPRVLILCPTRELAEQIAVCAYKLSASARAKGAVSEIRVRLLVGGETEVSHAECLKKLGGQVVIGTPGRVLSLIEKGLLDVGLLQTVVLDEADELVSRQFDEDINAILQAVRRHAIAVKEAVEMKMKKEWKKSASPSSSTSSSPPLAKPAERLQILAFSATLPRWLSESLHRILKGDPVRVTAGDGVNGNSLGGGPAAGGAGASGFPSGLRHAWVSVPRQEGRRVRSLAFLLQTPDLLSFDYSSGENGSLSSPRQKEGGGIERDLLPEGPPSITRTIVFCDNRHQVQLLASHPLMSSFSKPLQSEMTSPQRRATLIAFHQNAFPVLITTNIAARGLDFPSVPCVIHYGGVRRGDDTETYIHRAGRTARGGRLGVSLVLVDPSNLSGLRQLERALKIEFQMREMPASNTIRQVFFRHIENLIREGVGVDRGVFRDAASEIFDRKDEEEGDVREKGEAPEGGEDFRVGGLEGREVSEVEREGGVWENKSSEGGEDGLISVNRGKAEGAETEESIAECPPCSQSDPPSLHSPREKAEQGTGGEERREPSAHSVRLLAAALSLLEKKKRDLSWISPLSGRFAYTPLLFHDPYCEKINSRPHLMGILRRILPQEKLADVGRLALTTRGYVVDVPSSAASLILRSAELKEKGIRVSHVGVSLPKVVHDELRHRTKRRKEKEEDDAMRAVASGKRAELDEGARRAADAAWMRAARKAKRKSHTDPNARETFTMHAHETANSSSVLKIERPVRSAVGAMT
uniref:RNA helicase n=1 Tax=Chromera velia CCMP2878 TaxID=1169474 RepID=A0A0G4FKT8_9ALVE|eukprot:Cvel_3456.t1-p1 / transcript=Cvel_3456.t1 / gene=Cvel_3456 / organism=Chromera_velia_CCMP2878 / gene_product=DEAD-box ATP-dependent RNA helicase 7, putative / transcript_product=DEAD-box ATP-dependent RNA helicase 7, putative / location=Cvel_scaffold139:69265-71706(-) / protein_length=814 / sequence_SO=supercontig / SO=protein_coding / is_pseudo=false